MNIRSFFHAACAATVSVISASACAHGAGETVTLNFARAIANIPGKTLTAVVVDYAPGGLRQRTRMRNRPSSMHTSFRAPSSRR